MALTGGLSMVMTATPDSMATLMGWVNLDTPAKGSKNGPLV
jgi:hypothetical protein